VLPPPWEAPADAVEIEGILLCKFNAGEAREALELIAEFGGKFEFWIEFWIEFGIEFWIEFGVEFWIEFGVEFWIAPGAVERIAGAAEGNEAWGGTIGPMKAPEPETIAGGMPTTTLVAEEFEFSEGIGTFGFTFSRPEEDESRSAICGI